MIFNGHGGNTAAMDTVARDLRARHGMLAPSCSWYGLFDSSDLFDPRELVHGIHAHDVEARRLRVHRGAAVPAAVVG